MIMMNVGMHIACPFKVKIDDIDDDCNVVVIMNAFKMIVFFANDFFGKLFKLLMWEIMNCVQTNKIV